MRLIACAVMMALIAGCSGGSKTNPTPPPPPCSGDSCPGTAADLQVSVDKKTLQSSGTDTATITVTAVDANRNVVANAPVTIVPDGTTIITPSGTTTSTLGVVTGIVNIGEDHTNHTIGVTVTSGTITKTLTIGVQGTTLQATVTPQTLNPGDKGTIIYHLTDAGSNDVANQNITVTGPTPSTPTPTDQNGEYTYSYTAPSTPGTLVITAQTAGGTSVTSNVTVVGSAGGGSVPVAVGTVVTKSISADPGTIPVNADGGTSNKAEVRVLLLGANGVPIPNMRVLFDLAGDANSVGGTFSTGNNYAYTDSLGYARTQYIPGPTGSGPNKLTIRGCFAHDDFSKDCTKAEDSVTTTVTVTANGISLGAFTDYKITKIPTRYQITFTARVVDSGGSPISGVAVDATVYQPQYYKGQFIVGLDATNGNHENWIPWEDASHSITSCDNKDINNNNNLDTFEDVDGSGYIEPRAGHVSINRTATTDAFGNATFILDYGQSDAFWSSYRITFHAAVASSEGTYQLSGLHLPTLADDINLISADPPFKTSPYGTLDGSPTTVYDPLDTQQTKPFSLCTVKG